MAAGGPVGWDKLGSWESCSDVGSEVPGCKTVGGLGTGAGIDDGCRY
jgi:hypothetical protein